MRGRHGGAGSASDAVAEVHGWNARKRRFDPLQSGLAWNTLRAKAWREPPAAAG